MEYVCSCFSTNMQCGPEMKLLLLLEANPSLGLLLQFNLPYTYLHASYKLKEVLSLFVCLLACLFLKQQLSESVVWVLCKVY